MTNLENLNFGEFDAESEMQMLSEYFFDNGTLGQIKNGQKRYFLGRKGSGKTALFLQAQKTKISQEVISLDFDDYCWDMHKRIREEGVPEENSYTASWRFTFLISACKNWKNCTNQSLKKKSEDLYNKIYGPEDVGLLNILFDKLRRIRKIDLPSIDGLGGGGGIELEDDLGKILASRVKLWSDILEEFVVNHYNEQPFTITIDRLDDGWDATEESKNMLAGVLKAARQLNIKLQKPQKPAPVIVFLRSDIYSELRFNDKNKLGSSQEHLDWAEEDLIKIIEERIRKTTNTKEMNAWDTVFSNKEMRQRASIKSYILKRTMLRPRDIIAYCIFCLDSARKNKHEKIETDDIYEAEKRYSRHIYDELDDEMHKQIPDCKDLLQVLRDVALTRLTKSKWIEAYSRRFPEDTEELAKEKLKILFDYSIVGVPKKGGKSRGTKFQFIYNDRLLEPNFDGDMTVHFSLHKELSLKEPRTPRKAKLKATEAVT
ncbi:P-loop ATPase, Sll1717 family [Stutzerimonas nitrititolerans]|uniref:P-loop ATPase, Sll1717 family n=1 Tax=Stutzerimonas nitrititolerans TaxID=2482751 RepID=UPI003F80937A